MSIVIEAVFLRPLSLNLFFKDNYWQRWLFLIDFLYESCLLCLPGITYEERRNFFTIRAAFFCSWKIQKKMFTGRSFCYFKEWYCSEDYALFIAPLWIPMSLITGISCNLLWINSLTDWMLRKPETLYFLNKILNVFSTFKNLQLPLFSLKHGKKLQNV